MKKYFLLFFTEFILLMFQNNIVKISEILTSETCWKPASKLPTLSIFAWFAAIFTMGKNKYEYFFKTDD